MDVIEFLQRTNHRNLKYNINYLVKQKLRDWISDVNNRRQRLQELLNSEEVQYEKELALLSKWSAEERNSQRHEWIGQMRLSRDRSEEELLQLKKIQQDRENSEEVRHIRSREMLLESKQAQLYQIEEKKVLQEKNARLEHFWLRSMQEFNQQKEKQEIVEQKLRKVIANAEQQKNLCQDAGMKTKALNEATALQEEINYENERLSSINAQYQKDEDFYEWRKKLHHHDMLRRQIHHNAIKKTIERQMGQLEENSQNRQVQFAILSTLDKEGAEAVQNRTFHKQYLEDAFKEKKQQREEEQNLDSMFLGTGCVLEQKDKRPYGRNVR